MEAATVPLRKTQVASRRIPAGIYRRKGTAEEAAELERLNLEERRLSSLLRTSQKEWADQRQKVQSVKPQHRLSLTKGFTNLDVQAGLHELRSSLDLPPRPLARPPTAATDKKEEEASRPSSFASSEGVRIGVQAGLQLAERAKGIAVGIRSLHNDRFGDLAKATAATAAAAAAAAVAAARHRTEVARLHAHIEQVRHAKVVWMEGVVPVWAYHGGEEAGVPLEHGFIYLGNEAVREQQLRLLAFVQASLAQLTFLVKVHRKGM